MDEEDREINGCLQILTEFSIMAWRSTNMLRPHQLWPRADGAYKTILVQIRDQHLTESLRAKDEWYGKFILKLSNILIEQLLLANQMAYYAFYGDSCWLLSSSMREQAIEYSEKSLSKVLLIAKRAISMPVERRNKAEPTLELADYDPDVVTTVRQ